MRGAVVYEWDAGKATANWQKHRVAFKTVEGFDWATAKTVEDLREEYGETRYISFGFISERLYVLVWTPRQRRRRVISLRKANKREEGVYYAT